MRSLIQHKTPPPGQLNETLLAKQRAEQAQRLIGSAWLEHPTTKIVLRELKTKRDDLILRAQNATTDITRHAQCVQFLSESHILTTVINNLEQQ